ncbi:MAG: bifunctional folylpolyglutamate synthase/dihydrofolate synthase [Candidatus Omnitrophica bacterium]|nr:bifunctional folylpolyglutamate synthase/dihydrofolate synthase [Candidatus Omnitrophota bacterium]
MTSYAETLRYLDSLTNYEKIGLEKSRGRIELSRVRDVLEALGSPQAGYRIAHVAGTKGKGSVCAFTASMLESAGLRTGSYISPHLVTPLERISINGENISQSDFLDIVSRIKRVSGRTGLTLTYFEFLTVMAMEYFARGNADVAVLETGMGGRLDATNAVRADVSCITPVSYDHTHVLGESLEQIAAEKAGIIKKGSRCVISPQDDRVMDVIDRRCRKMGAEKVVVGEDIKWDVVSCDETGSVFDLYTSAAEIDQCGIGLPGRFQAENCAAAAGICQALPVEGLTPDAIRRGAGRAFIPARLEVVARDPMIVLDGAQNAYSAAALVRAVREIFRYDRVVLVLGLAGDKDMRGVCDELSRVADEVVLTRAENPRASDPAVIRGYLKGTAASLTFDTREALGRALSRAGKNDLILVAGSFYVAGEIRELIRNKRG